MGLIIKWGKDGGKGEGKAMREATKGGSNLYQQGDTAHSDELGRLYKERGTTHTD